MTTKRRVGEQRSTDEGVDDLGGSHATSTRHARQRARADAAADAAVAEGLPAGEAVTPDSVELDRRDRRKSRSRKASGPMKAPTDAATPTAPAPTAPPPSDPQ